MATIESQILLNCDKLLLSELLSELHPIWGWGFWEKGIGIIKESAGTLELGDVPHHSSFLKSELAIVRENRDTQRGTLNYNHQHTVSQENLSYLPQTCTSIYLPWNILFLEFCNLAI